MDLTAKDIVGQSAYEFYHAEDMNVIQDAHAICKWHIDVFFNESSDIDELLN